MEVEDDKKWGDGGESHDVMCATVLSEVYGIEINEVLQRVSAAELMVIGNRMEDGSVATHGSRAAAWCN